MSSNTQKSSNIKKRRRLSELYARGAEVRFNPSGAAAFDPKKTVEVEVLGDDGEPTLDAEGDPITTTAPLQVAGMEDFERTDDDIVLWVQPPSPLQREQALREAQAKRARAVLTARRDEDSADAANIQVFVAEMPQGTLIDYVLSATEQERREAAQREVLAEDEWEDFASLQDAMRQWDEAGNPRSDEWKSLIDRDVEFGRQVAKSAKYLRETDREALEMMSRAELERKAFEKRVELIGSQAFVQEYERQMVFYATRDGDDHNELYFEDVTELAHQDDLIQEVLSDTLSTFIEDPGEAKNSQRAVPGSETSELPAEPETSEASTPEEPIDLMTSPGSSKPQSSTLSSS